MHRTPVERTGEAGTVSKGDTVLSPNRRKQLQKITPFLDAVAITVAIAAACAYANRKAAYHRPLADLRAFWRAFSLSRARILSIRSGAGPPCWPDVSREERSAVLKDPAAR